MRNTHSIDYVLLEIGHANVSDTLTAQRFIVDLLSMPPFSVKNAKNINSFDRFPLGSSMKPTSKLTV
ncbi:hypothetical protein PROSTU_04847 [Providencia stuartii ATCC 25827]|uniref:Uncharacterized protein n=1 Tax=Providencia stuartii ATCC 25827 TaxID=471874 RepID=A0AA87CP47_PROST|nr:hypothetical protein PROSTU_04847 [Providencia stuartii ATCC 25827]